MTFGPHPGQLGEVDPAVVARVLESAGQRVTEINQTTRDGLAEIVAQGVEQGMGPAELGNAISAWSGWDEYRAEMIARTETGMAFNETALATYRDGGIEQVQVTDGDDDEICLPWHDVTVPIDEAPEPLGHPNCTRDIIPVVAYTPEDYQTAREMMAPEPITLPESVSREYQFPTPDTSPAGVEDATSAWTGIHYADVREYMQNGVVREGFSLADDPIHGISEARAAQAASTLSQLVADGKPVPALFRGLNVDDAAFARLSSLRSGESLDMVLSSWSSDGAEAAKFASRATAETSHSVVLQVTDAQGFDMSSYSFYPGEKEWLTDGRFTVQSVEQSGDTLVVRLHQDAVFSAPTSGVR